MAGIWKSLLLLHLGLRWTAALEAGEARAASRAKRWLVLVDDADDADDADDDDDHFFIVIVMFIILCFYQKKNIYTTIYSYL